MKKSVLRLIPAFIFAALSFEAAAQNVQLHYDLGRKAPTTYDHRHPDGSDRMKFIFI